MKRRFEQDLESVFERPSGRGAASAPTAAEFGEEGERAWSRGIGYTDEDLDRRFASQQGSSVSGAAEQLMDEATIKRLIAEERRKALDPDAPSLAVGAPLDSSSSKASRPRSESPPLPSAEWLTQLGSDKPTLVPGTSTLHRKSPSPVRGKSPPKKKRSRWGQPASAVAAAALVEDPAIAAAASSAAASASASDAAASAAQVESSARASAAAVASLSPGALVRLQGLRAAAHLNGEKARLIRLDSDTGRWEVRMLKSMESKAIKPDNLEPQDSDDEDQQEPAATAVADSWIPPRSPTPERTSVVDEPPVAPPSPPQQAAAAPVYGTGRSASGGVAGLSSSSLANGPTVAQRFAALPMAAKPRPPPRQMGTVRWYNGRRKLGVIIPDSGGKDLFIPAQGAVNGSQVPPQPGGLFHGTRVSFQPTALKSSDAVNGKSDKKETVCMDVRPLSGQVGLSAGVESFIGAKEKNDDKIAATDLRELGFLAGIFDGHLGSTCAEYVSKQVPESILTCYRARVKREGGVAKLTHAQEARIIEKSIVDAFEEVDKAYLVTARKKDLSDGSTGLVALLSHGFQVPQAVETAASLWPPDRNAQKPVGTVPRASGGVAKLFVAWCGDSRAVLLRGRQGFRLSEDHRPNNRSERQRVREAGGTVTKDARGIWRVGPREENRLAKELERRKKKDATSKWYLSTSRSFGDLALKVPDPIVTATPEVKVVDLVPEDWAVVLGSDGIFDVLSDQEVANVLYKAMAVDGKDPVGAAKDLVQAAFRAGSRDNLTAITLRLGWSPPPSSDDPILVGGAAVEEKKGEFDMFG